MGLIIKDKIQMLMKGYPTVSDKYNVAGAVLDGDANVYFGDLVKFGATKGYFEAAAGAEAVADIAGFVVATNVKLAEGFPGRTAPTVPGEAFNLLVNGFIAVELDGSAVEGNIAANKAVAVILGTGKVTTSGVDDSVNLPNVVFTGAYEKHGDVWFAEIYVK